MNNRRNITAGATNSVEREEEEQDSVRELGLEVEDSSSPDEDEASKWLAEAKDRKTRPLSGSSNGSATGDFPGERKSNPFMKATSSHRKDYQYVT